MILVGWGVKTRPASLLGLSCESIPWLVGPIDGPGGYKLAHETG